MPTRRAVHSDREAFSPLNSLQVDVDQFNSKNYPIFANFLNKLAKDLTKFYYKKLDKPFKISNKLKGKGYDPVTTSIVIPNILSPFD